MDSELRKLKEKEIQGVRTAHSKVRQKEKLVAKREALESERANKAARDYCNIR